MSKPSSDFYFKKTKFPLPIYGYRIWIIVTDNLARALEKEKIDVPEDIAAINGYHVKDRDTANSWLFFQPSADLNTMAHEAIHVTQSIISWIGAGYQDREFVAYLGAYIIQGVEDIVRHWQEDYKTKIQEISQNEKLPKKRLTKPKK